MGVYYSHCLIPRERTIRPAPEQLAALIAAWVDKGFVVGPEGISARARTGSSQSMADTGACFRTNPPLGRPVTQEQPQPEPPRSFLARLLGSPQQTKQRQPVDPRTPFSIPPVGISLTALSQPDALIAWAPNPNAAYPMDTVADPPAEPHMISIELADDFLNPNTDLYGIGQDTKQLDAICPCGHDLAYEGAADWLETNRIRRICPACGQAFRPHDHPAEIVDDATGAKIPFPGGHCRRFAITIDFGKDHPIYRRNASGELIDAKPKASDIFLKTCETALGFELIGLDVFS